MAPGAALSIPGRVDVGRIVRASRQSVRLTLADGRAMACELKWTVRPTYLTSPQSLAFYVLDELDSPPQRVEFRSDRMKLVSDPVSDSPWLSATREGNEILIRVNPAKAPSGRSVARVSLMTDDPDVPLLMIPVAVDRLGRLNVFPSSVALGPDQSQMIFVTDEVGEFVEVTAESSNSAVVAIVRGPGRVEIRSEFRGDSAPRDADVRIQDTDGNSSAILVEILRAKE